MSSPKTLRPLYTRRNWLASLSAEERQELALVEEFEQEELRQCGSRTLRCFKEDWLDKMDDINS